MNGITRAGHAAAETLREKRAFILLLPVAIGIGALLVLPVPEIVVMAGLAVVPATLVAILIFRNLFLGLILYLIFEYLQPGHRIDVISRIHPTLLIAAAMLLSWTLRAMRHRMPVVINWQVKSYAVFMILGAISAFSAISTGMVVLTMIDMAKMFLIFWVMLNITTTLGQLQRLVWVYVALHIILAAVGFALFATSGERRMGDVGGGFLGDENDSAMALLIMIPYMYFLWPKVRNRLVRLMLAAGMIMSSLAVLFSFSRGAFLGFVTMMTYMWLKSTKKIKSGLLLMAILLALFTIMPGEYWQRIESMQEYSTEGSAQGRLDAWKAGIQMMLDSPLLGCGLGNFSRTYGTTYNTISARWTAAHSMYIEFIAQLGVPGLLFLLATIFLTLRTFGIVRRISRRFKSEEFATLQTFMLGAECGFVTYLVTTIFLNSMEYPHLWHFGAIAGIGLRVARNLRDEATLPSPLDERLQAGVKARA